MNKTAEKKRALLIIACLHHGGTEMQTLHTASALVSLGYDVRVLCLFDSEAEVRALFESIGVTIECLDLKNPHNYPEILWRIARAIRVARPDVAHVQYIAPGLLSVLAARLARVRRVLITVHQVGSGCTPWEHCLFRVATRLANLTLCVSDAVERSWFEAGPASGGFPHPGHSVVVPNCVEPGPAARNDRETASRPWTIGYVGRIRQEKGVDVLVRAASILAASGADFRVIVVGDGPEREGCEILASSLGVADRIEWRGFVSPDRLPGVYQGFDVLAVPSLQEGFGLVAVEAMAQGVPVVAARTGGLPEIVEHGGNGLLFTPGDPDALAAALNLVMSDRRIAQRLSAAARESVVARFSPNAYRQQIGSLYAGVAGAQNR